MLELLFYIFLICNVAQVHTKLICYSCEVLLIFFVVTHVSCRLLLTRFFVFNLLLCSMNGPSDLRPNEALVVDRHATKTGENAHFE